MELNTAQLIEQVIQSRQKALMTIQSRLNPVLHESIAKKLQAEARAATALSSADKVSAAARAHYSFVLDPQYFEQKFLN